MLSNVAIAVSTLLAVLLSVITAVAFVLAMPNPMPLGRAIAATTIGCLVVAAAIPACLLPMRWYIQKAIVKLEDETSISE